MKNEKIIGRPKLPDALAKDSVLQVRMTAHDLALVELAAQRAKQAKAEWARNVLIKAAS